MIKRWSDLVNGQKGKNLTAKDHLYYLVLKGKNWHKAFLPGRKMQDYDCPQGYYNAIYSRSPIFDEVFRDILAKDWEKKIHLILPTFYKVDYSEPYMNEEVEKMINSMVKDNVVA
jgi:hypothetical protein